MRTRMLGLAIAALLGAGIASAVTQQWSYERPMAAVYQILGDGSGGCAISAVDTNGLHRVAWLNSKEETVCGF